MSRWIVKAALQGVLSRFPNPQRYNRLFQTHVTRSLTMSDQDFIAKWHHLDGHLGSLRRHGRPGQRSFAALELGTGWFPIVPVGLALSGARFAVLVPASMNPPVAANPPCATSRRADAANAARNTNRDSRAATARGRRRKR